MNGQTFPIEQQNTKKKIRNYQTRTTKTKGKGVELFEECPTEYS